ncbi:SDR family oxidoreductase [Azotobacter beijerinckii]|uniref:NADH-flavin reductase n=1 Tax=Azotobacter beijerinckii TaxID=170623 RepID=A0A1I4EB50_9GAMM|nr:SDR family oxidoreductase [Azotobacter beijerinckii]SFA96921.1 Putative NADH-flavin reductase [Azotobacter beijerinckii]SFL02982.1 Putative NADH-flavin reductase [Azotobacter beijerinckii]
MRKIVLLFGLLVASFLAIGASVSNGAGSSRAGEPADAQKANPTMKNVILIGANGSTSKEIIPRLLEQDDVKLTLFLRRASRMQHMQSDRVNVVEGDAAELADLKRAIRGQDIVISTMGGMDLDAKTANIVKAMKEVGARYVIVISAGGIYDELPEPFNARDKRMVGQYRPINLKTAEVAEQSGLTYTVLRPVWLTDKPTEEFQLTRKGETYKGTETSRASIGRFVADLVKDPQRYANQNLGISQLNTDGDRPAAYR